MKTIVFTLISLLSFLLVSTELIGQDFMLGPRISVFSTSNETVNLAGIDSDERSNFRIQTGSEKWGYQVGMFGRFEVLGLFVQPEALLRSTGTQYKLTYASTNEVTFTDERFYFLDLPVNAGAQFGPFRIQAGPSFSFLVHRTSDLDDPPNFQRDFREVEFALQAGLGLDIWRLVFDLRYHYTVNRSFDNLTVDETSYDLSDKLNLVIFSVGYDLRSEK